MTKGHREHPAQTSSSIPSQLCKLWAGAAPPLGTGRSESSRDPPRTCREWGSECWSPNQAPLSTRADNPTPGRTHHLSQAFWCCGGCNPMRMGVTPHPLGWLFLEDPEWAPAASTLLPVLPRESSLPTLGESFTYTDSKHTAPRGKFKLHGTPHWLCSSSSHSPPVSASGASQLLFPQTFPVGSALASASQPVVTGRRLSLTLPDQAKARPPPQSLSAPQNPVLFSY